MKKIRFTETQIVAILKQADTGMKVAAISSKFGISNAVY
jgi:putative transposase